MSKSAQSLICDIAIVGAGPTGGALALLAAKAGFDTILIDARDLKSAGSRDGRNFAIVRGSWRLLEAAGLAQSLRDTAQPLNGLEAIDGGTHYFGGPSVLFSNDDLGEGDGPLGYMVEAQRILPALANAIDEQEGLRFLAPARFAGLERLNGRVRIDLEDGRGVEASLLAGCDGVNSPVRRAAGIAVEGRAYGKSVFAANVNLERPHGGVARQLFTPEGPFATLPLTGNRANLAWYMKSGAAEALAEQQPGSIEAELNHRFSEFAGRMTLASEPFAYPLHLKIAEKMVGDHLALVGDAARRINPLAGQGLNLGFKDVGALIEIMCDARYEGLGIGAPPVLQRYQQWRRFDANSMALTMDGIDRAFSNNNPALKPLRGLGLTLANSVGPLRKALARRASADEASLPKLLRGEAPW